MRCRSVMSLFLALSCFACHTSNRSSGIKDLAADPAAHNIALILTARVLNDADRADYPVIVAMMKSAFSELSAGSTFDLRSKQMLTRVDIINSLETAARDAGENGTIFWYISSHGRDGKLRSYDAQTMESSELVDALRRGRTVDGKFTPIKRLYMIFDFCEAEVAGADFHSAAVPLELLDMNTARGENNPAINLLKAFKPQEVSDSQQFSLREESVVPAVASQMIVYAVASKVQSTYSFSFLSAVANALNSVKYGSQVTLGDFFVQTTESIAVNSQKSAYLRDQYPVPQQAAIFTYPDNSILSEKLYGHLTATWENAATPCPPWGKYPWNFGHGRDLTGECIDVSGYCVCIRVIESWNNSVCRIYSPKHKKAFYEEPAEEDQRISSTYCYATCDQIASRSNKQLLELCGGKFIVKNALERAEISDWSSDVPKN